MKKFLLLFLSIFTCAISFAQLLKMAPYFPKDNDNITLIFDASKGNKGLNNYAGDVYIHTGVITNLSANSADWKYVPTTWNTNTPAHRLTPLGNNRYSFTISNIRSFYNVPNGETIKKIAMVFRSYNVSGNPLEGKCSDLSADQGNMYWEIYPPNTNAIRFTDPPFEPRYNLFLLPLTANINTMLYLRAQSSKTANLEIKLNGTMIANKIYDTIATNATITSTGNNVFEVLSNDGTTVAKDSFTVYVAPANSVLPLPAGVKEGINYSADATTATLVLYAPNKTRVNLLGDFNNFTESLPYQMNVTPDGKYYWLKITALTPGTEYAYQYLVDGSLRIGDPYCEKVLDPDNDKFIDPATYPSLKPYPTGKTNGIVSVLQTAAPAYNWQVNNFQRPDQRKLVIYEILVRDFVEKHDFTTLKDSIGYFKSLGVNALHLMPINEFEGNLSWGYNPSYYFAPDKFYGPKNTLKAFIDECHKNGIAVVLDMVLNHSFGQSPMVQLYYDGALNRPAANNPWFNPVAKHAYNVGFDMNHESADTKRFFSNVCAFWLAEYKVDGFRFDLSKGFTQKQTCDASGGNCDVNGWSAYDASRIAIWKNYYDTLQLKSPGSYVILEHLAANNEEAELSNYGMLLWGNMNYNFTEAAKGQVTNSDFTGALHTSRGFTKPHLVAYMESHDEERSMVKCKTEGLSNGSYNIKDEATALKRNELAAAFLLTLPGPKLIWQFGELGYDYSINYCSNGTVNQSCRTDQKPVKWNYYTDVKRMQLRNVYASLLALRKNAYYSDLFVNGKTETAFSNGTKWMKLTSDTSKLVVLGNFALAESAVSISFPQSGIWYDLFTGETFAATGALQSINLPAGAYKVYLNRNLNGTVPTRVDDVEFSDVFRLRVRPNPVSDASVISYELPETGHVRLRLIDIQGRTIEDIPVGLQAKGAHTSRLKNTAVANLQKGVYFLQLAVNGKRKLVKVLVQ
jgi:1,4-alpha-glucan branching enzyme